MDMQRNDQGPPGPMPAAATGPGQPPAPAGGWGGDRGAGWAGDRGQGQGQDRGPSRFPAERMKTVYALTERPNGKTSYTRIGVGFVNRDDSITLKLDALPTSGTMQIREYQRYEDGDRRGDGRGDGHARHEGPERGARAGIPF